MIFQESKDVRTIVGRLEEGEECVEALTDFCREHGIEAGEVRAIGRLDRVEVVRFDPEAEESGGWVPVFEGEGNFDVLNIVGNISKLGDEIVVRLEAVLAAEGPVGPQVVTGKLRAGRAVEFEFVLDAFDDLGMERRLDAETGLLKLNAITKEQRDPPESADDATGGSAGRSAQSGGGQAGAESQDGNAPQDDQANEEKEEMTGQAMTWSDVARDSEEGQESSGSQTVTVGGPEPGEDEDDDLSSIYGEFADEPALEAGDILDHPKLGRCRVMKVEDGKYAHIRLPRGKIRKLSLDVVRLEFKGEEDDRNIFEAQVGR